LDCPQWGFQTLSPLRQSAGVVEHCKISNPKHQISGFQVSGVRCQVSGKKNKKTETSVFETGKAIELWFGPKGPGFRC